MAPLSLEPVTWRVRALAAGGRTVADSRSALLVLSTMPCRPTRFPNPTSSGPRCPTRPGDPLTGAAGYALLDNAHVEVFLEEDEPVPGHPRDIYHRVDAIASSRHVQVTLGGETLAESTRPMAVFETGAPTRFYLAQSDVRLDLLEPSETTTTSPYMGSAVWFGARIDGELHPDVAWTYRFTIPQLPRIAGLLAFRDELVRELPGD